MEGFTPNYLIAIDAGTSSTRVCLTDEKKRRLALFKSETGVRNTAIDGHNGALKQAVREGIEQVLHQSGVPLDRVRAVYAGGMITSNVGLAEIPHLTAPAGLSELAAGVRAAAVPNVCALPIHFVPGVKNDVPHVDLTTCGNMDMMRGEELETMALLSLLPPGKGYLLALPGSHTKFVAADASGRISGCLTTISGELLAALTHHTILADAVQGQFVEPGQYRRELVLAGYHEAERSGLGRAAFSARILTQFGAADPIGAANFLLGAVLREDAAVLESAQEHLGLSPETELVVAGKFPFQQALTDIFTESGLFAAVHGFQNPGELPLSALGAWLVAEKRGCFQP